MKSAIPQRLIFCLATAAILFVLRPALNLHARPTRILKTPHKKTTKTKKKKSPKNSPSNPSAKSPSPPMKARG